MASQRHVVAAIEVDPELMLFALDEMAAAAKGRRGRVDALGACADAYCRWHELDDDNPAGDTDLAVIHALAVRVMALMHHVEDGHLAHPADEDERVDAVAAASAARPIEKDGRWTFQPLDFQARLDRLRATARSGML